LDLALRQCGLSLAAALGRPARPLTFVHSPAPGTDAPNDLAPSASNDRTLPAGLPTSPLPAPPPRPGFG
jgi:hypothetical protein